MNLKTPLKYGAISGLIIVASWFVTFFIWGEGNMHLAGGEILGYAVMLLALTAVFMGVKNVRDNSGDSQFTFKKGFLVGLGIVVVASVIYVVGWFLYMPNFAPNFIDKYESSQIELIQNSEAGDAEKQEKIQEIRASVATYRTPYGMAGMTFLEIFPVGLLVAIISALVLRRNPN